MSLSPSNSPHWHTLAEDGLVARVRIPVRPPYSAVFVLLHGWTGDEMFMAPFAELAPPDALVIALRAPYRARSPRGGYSWVDYIPTQPSPQFPAFQAQANALQTHRHRLAARFPQAPWHAQHWMGFSQGAAIAGVYALTFPHDIASVALLAGFLPRGSEPYIAGQPLQGKAVFIAHGTDDAIVPLARAYQARELLRAAGADVTFCEDAVGHKVGARCHKALAAFYQNLIPG